MGEFLQRLKQRKLVQWALAYAAFAFALLQGVDVVAQQFGWPGDVRRGITIAVAIGFFFVLVLAWYHGERGIRRVTGTEGWSCWPNPLHRAGQAETLRISR